MEQDKTLTYLILKTIIDYQDGRLSEKSFLKEMQHIKEEVVEKLIEHVVRNYGFRELPPALHEYLRTRTSYQARLRKECFRVISLDLAPVECERFLSRTVKYRETLSKIYARFWEFIMTVDGNDPRRIVLAADVLVHTTHTLEDDDEYNVLGDRVSEVKRELDEYYERIHDLRESS